jgi:hypothetical protein
MKTLIEPVEIEHYDFEWQQELLAPIDPELAAISHGYQPKTIEPDDLSVLQRRVFEANPDDYPWVAEQIKDLPDYLTKYFVTRYIAVLEKKGRKEANIFLRDRLGPAAQRSLMVLRKYKKLPTTQKVALLSEEYDNTEQSDFPPQAQIQFNFDQAERNRKPVKSRLLAELAPSEIKDIAFKISQITRAKFQYIADSVAKCDLEKSDIPEVMGYEALAEFVSQFGIAPPRKRKQQTAMTALNDISRMLDEKWWQGRLNKIRKIMREHLAIAMGQVSSKASPYASWDCVREHQEQQRANYEYIKQHSLIDGATGEEVDMWDMVKGSISNPAIRRHELMVRCRGCEDIGNELGLQGLFLTLTTPSKYHNSYKKGGFINHWNGASPRDAQAYLNNVWQRIRAKLGREELRWFGVRVAEPHHDGTPHWHLLIWVKPEEKEAVSKIFIDYAVQEDKHELFKGRVFDYSPRCDVGEIDPEKGTATGYIAKYISKNIDGYAMDDDVSDETGKPVKDMAKNVGAWKSRWCIRQFQFFGGAPVTTYRELRRFANQNKKAFLDYLFMQERVDLLTLYSMLQRDLVGPIKPSKLISHQELLKVISDQYQSRIKTDDPSVTDTLKAADQGHWQGYIMGQGGPFVKRDDLLIVNSYEVLPFASPHGEDVLKIEGFRTPQAIIKTRTKVWTIQKKGQETDQVDAVALALSGSAAAPWSPVNNCTPPVGGPVKGEIDRELDPLIEYEVNRLIIEYELDDSFREKLIEGRWLKVSEEKSVKLHLGDGQRRPDQIVYRNEYKPDLSWLGEMTEQEREPLTEENYQQPNLSHFEYVDEWPLV